MKYMSLSSAHWEISVSTGRNREHFGAIGQVFGQLTITGDEPLSRESLYAETPTPFPLNRSNSVIVALVLRGLNQRCKQVRSRRRLAACRHDAERFFDPQSDLGVRHHTPAGTLAPFVAETGLA